jgi:chemotaxis protein histidine kinase CheA
MEEVYLFFLEEALELLPSIGADLCQLSARDDREVSLEARRGAIAHLLGTVATLERGATQVNATELQILTTRLAQLLQPNQRYSTLQARASEPYLLKQLWQIYAELKHFLLIGLSREPLGLTGILAKGESVFALARPRALPQETVDEQEVDVPKALLSKDVAESLAYLETAINNPTADNLSVELQKQAEVFLGLGELLEIADFITIARGAISLGECCRTALGQTNPQATLLIARRALASWRATYEKVSQELAIKSSSLTNFPVHNNSKETSFISVPTTASELTLNAANLFLWLSGFNLFFLAADSIAEIIMPQPEQIICSDNQQFVLWRCGSTRYAGSRLLPLYQLSTLLQDDSHLPANNPSPAVPESSLILVIRQNRAVLVERGVNSLPIVHGDGEAGRRGDGGRKWIPDFRPSVLALAIDVERLIVASELTLKPFSPLLETTPDYLAGCTWLEVERMVTAIDILALLRHHRKQREDHSF